MSSDGNAGQYGSPTRENFTFAQCECSPFTTSPSAITLGVLALSHSNMAKRISPCGFDLNSLVLLNIFHICIFTFVLLLLRAV